MVEEKIKKQKKKKEKTIAEAKINCKDKECPIHGNLKTRGRRFRGKVTRKFHKRIAIEFERNVYVQKYERYKKERTRIHARLPECMEDEVNLGESVEVMECRPLSKIIHFVVVKKIKEKEK